MPDEMWRAYMKGTYCCIIASNPKCVIISKQNNSLNGAASVLNAALDCGVHELAVLAVPAQADAVWNAGSLAAGVVEFAAAADVVDNPSPRG